MIRLGATGSQSHLDLCRALETVFRRSGVEFDWVLYSGYDEMVAAFVRGEINLAWNGPLSHVKMRRAFPEGAPVVALRDVDVGFTTRFITRADSAIDTVEDLPGARFAFAARDSVEAGLLPVYFLKGMGINPSRQLAAADFFDQREPLHPSDQVDVALQVLNRSYDAGAVSGRTLETLSDRHGIDPGALRVFWSSPRIQPLLLYGAARSGRARSRPGDRRAGIGGRQRRNRPAPSSKPKRATGWCPALMTGGNWWRRRRWRKGLSGERARCPCRRCRACWAHTKLSPGRLRC